MHCEGHSSQNETQHSDWIIHCCRSVTCHRLGSLGVVGQESALATVVQQLSVLLGVHNVGVSQCQLLQARYKPVRLKQSPNIMS